MFVEIREFIIDKPVYEALTVKIIQAFQNFSQHRCYHCLIKDTIFTATPLFLVLNNIKHGT